MLFILAPTYVNLVTLRDDRDSPFLDDHNSSRSYWLTVLAAAPLTFMFSGIVCLRGRYDLSEFGFKQQLTLKQVFYYNYFVWTMAFFLGLQFTHADQGIMRQFTLDWHQMQKWDFALWVIFIVMIVMLLYIAIVVVSTYIRIGVLKYYIVWTIILLLLFGLRSIGAADVHFHHYVMAAFVVSFVCYQSVLLTAFHGIACGIMIEGGTRWGYDKIWRF